MKLLADQDVYAMTVALLRGGGHDVATAAELGLAQASDVDLLQVARRDERVFITRDRDYGSLVFVEQIHAGVIYLRVSPSTLGAVHEELERVLGQYQEQELLRAFVVVEPARHRIRNMAS